MNKKIKLIVLVLVFALLLGGAYLLYSRYATEPEAPELEQEEQLPPVADFTVYDAEGNPVKLSDYFGKPIVLNFWASWCNPCKQEMPAFQKAWETYGDQVQFLMVNMTDGYQETKYDADAFIERSGYTFPVFYDTTLDAAMTHTVYSIPTTIFIDKDGGLLLRKGGAMSYDYLEDIIQQLIP